MNVHIQIKCKLIFLKHYLVQECISSSYQKLTLIFFSVKWKEKAEESSLFAATAIWHKTLSYVKGVDRYILATVSGQQEEK